MSRGQKKNPDQPVPGIQIVKRGQKIDYSLILLLLLCSSNPIGQLCLGGPDYSSCTVRARLHGGGVPLIGEVTYDESPYLTCKRDQIKMRDHMDRRVTSPTWSPQPPCKQVLNVPHSSVDKRDFNIEGSFES